jgi:hypothetical protein
LQVQRNRVAWEDRKFPGGGSSHVRLVVWVCVG